MQVAVGGWDFECVVACIIHDATVWKDTIYQVGHRCISGGVDTVLMTGVSYVGNAFCRATFVRGI